MKKQNISKWTTVKISRTTLRLLVHHKALRERILNESISFNSAIFWAIISADWLLATDLKMTNKNREGYAEDLFKKIIQKDEREEIRTLSEEAEAFGLLKNKSRIDFDIF